MYPKYLEELRHEPVTLLEIGIGEQGSCKMWSEYFDAEGCRFIGIDRLSSKEIPRWKFHVADQSNPKDIGAIGRQHSPLDIVIDDGSHHAEHQRTSFEALWPYVTPGGLYFIEDIRCSYINSNASLMPYLFNIVEDVVTSRLKFNRKGSDKSFVHFYPHIVVIGK